MVHSQVKGIVQAKKIARQIFDRLDKTHKHSLTKNDLKECVWMWHCHPPVPLPHAPRLLGSWMRMKQI